MQRARETLNQICYYWLTPGLPLSLSRVNLLISLKVFHTFRSDVSFIVGKYKYYESGIYKTLMLLFF